MSSQGSAAHEAFNNAMHHLDNQVKKRNLHISTCNAPKVGTLLPNCCGDLHILVQKEKDKVDELWNNINNS